LSLETVPLARICDPHKTKREREREREREKSHSRSQTVSQRDRAVRVDRESVKRLKTAKWCCCWVLVY